MPLFVTQSSAPGRGAIAVVELAGEDASRVASALFDRPLPSPGLFSYGRLQDQGEVVDEVVLRVILPEDSFTGFPTVEICCHGGEVALERVISALEKNGAMRADEERRIGEAVRNGKMDSFQADAWRLLPGVWTERAARVLLDQAAGALSHAVREGRDVLDTAAFGIALTSPPKLVIAGRPNVGKSSLFNALVSEDRVIVRDEEGTTRDPVSERISIEGIPFELFDTAGVSGEKKPDLLESLSMERAGRRVGDADLVLFVHDATVGETEEESAFLARITSPVVRVSNKADLGDRIAGLPVSAITGEGLDLLRSGILEALSINPDFPPGSPVIFTPSQTHQLSST
jgi:tRNA modification GTPase